MPSFVSRVGGSLDPIAQLTQAEQDNNIMCIYGEMKGNYGWSDEAIAGMCGCFHEESHFNPGIYETGHGGNLNNLPYFAGGMGMAQWTDYPAYTATYPNPLPWLADKYNENWWDGIFQCFLFTKSVDPADTDMGYGQGPRWGWLAPSQSRPYPYIPFNDFINNTPNFSVAQATVYWFYDWEWHDPQAPAGYVEARQQWAQYAYDLFHGQTPDPPGPGPGPGPTPSTSKKMPLWMYLKRIPF